MKILVMVILTLRMVFLKYPNSNFSNQTVSKFIIKERYKNNKSRLTQKK